MRSRALLRPLALAAACAALACASQEPDPVPDPVPATVPGKYFLFSVADRELPVTIVRDSALEVAVTGGSITLAADSGFVDVRRFRVIAAGEAPATIVDTLVGAWSLNGDRVVFQVTAGEKYEMYWNGRSLTWYLEGFTHQFWK